MDLPSRGSIAALDLDFITFVGLFIAQDVLGLSFAYTLDFAL